MRAKRARQMPAVDIPRHQDEARAKLPPAVRLSPAKLRRYVLKAVILRNRWAERALIVYFRDAWDQGIEPDPCILRAYCEALFALSEGRPVLPNPPHRPTSMLAERNIKVAAMYFLLRQGDEPITREEALKRTGTAFNIGTKAVEAIISPKERSAQPRPARRQLDLRAMASLVNILNASERAELLRLLGPTEPLPP